MFQISDLCQHMNKIFLAYILYTIRIAYISVNAQSVCIRISVEAKKLEEEANILYGVDLINSICT